jgi:ribonuclease P protein component
VLAAANRLCDRRDFQQVARRGHRSGRDCLVVQLLAGDADRTDEPRVGFVVGRAVGGAVVRNQVKRRLRHHVRPHLDRLPAGSMLVVRANPTAATCSSATLAAELDRGLGKVLRRVGDDR